jgi:hypothetical protein
MNTIKISISFIRKTAKILNISFEYAGNLCYAFIPVGKPVWEFTLQNIGGIIDRCFAV